MPVTFSAALCLASAMVIVGSSVVAGRIMIAGLPLFFASSLRFALAAAVLWPLVRVLEGGLPRLSRRTWLILALQALCGSFLFTVCLLYGLKWTSPAAAGIVTSTTPACVGVIAWLAFREWPGRAEIAGILFAVAGIMALNLAGAGPGLAGANPLAGSLLVLAAVLCESCFLLLRKAVREPLSPLAASFLVSLLGLAWFAPFGLAEGAHAGLAAVPASAWWAVAYYGLVVTVGAYLLWFAGVVRVPAQTAGVFTALMPLSALATGWLLLGQAPGAGEVLGCLLVLAGLGCLSLRRT